MSSEIDICNMALSNIRSTGINSLNESSLQAQQCKLKYPFIRDMLLTEAPWGFAHRVEPLALTTDNIFNWVYSYQYPADCLYINRLVLNMETYPAMSFNPIDRLGVVSPDLFQKIPYEIYNIDGNRVIASNEAGLRISYRARISDPNIFSSQFVQALVHMMSSELAIPIVGAETGRQLRSDALNMYKSVMASAVAANSNQRYFAPVDSEFVTGRN